jgi:hypothetical protein
MNNRTILFAQQCSRATRIVSIRLGTLVLLAMASMASMLTISSTAQASTTWDWRLVSGSSISSEIFLGYDAFITEGAGGVLDGLSSGAIGYSDTGKDSTFGLADMRSEWTGLGVCNAIELGDCADFQSPDSTHQVDNQGEQDWVLFVFEPDVLLSFESLVHSPYGAADRDASYWIGTIEDENFDLRGLGYADLAGIGFGDRIDTSADFGEGTVTIDFGGAVGNSILIGAKLGDTDDRLKIATVQASVVPIPAAAWLFGSGLGLLGWVRARKNPG